MCSDADEEQRDLLAGNVAVIERGGCTFAEKIRRAQRHGAIGAIICTGPASSMAWSLT